MSMEWRDGLTGSLRRIVAQSQHMQDDLAYGAKAILEESTRLVPKESGHLASTGSIKRDRGGQNTVAIVYTSVYSHWIHEHLFFKHPHGGQAKFLEDAMLIKGREAINEAGQRFWRRIAT